MQILHNHIGYRPEANKVMIVQSTLDEPFIAGLKITLVKQEDCSVAARPACTYAGEVPGWKNRFFYRYDFSEVRTPGTYRFIVEGGGNVLYGNPFRIGEDVNDILMVSDIVHYFKGQRSSGRWDDTDRSIPFFGGREGRVDAHGGWFDAAGDYSKYLSHLSYANYLNPQQIPLSVWALSRAQEQLSANPEHASTLLSERLNEEAWWGGDFLMRMQDPQGYFYTTVFDTWSKENEKRMITAFRGKEGIHLSNYEAGFRKGSGMAIAALARLGRGDRTAVPSDGYTPEQALEAAQKGFRHLSEHNREYLDNGKENIIDCYCALCAAVELYRSTKQEEYLTEARSWATRLASHWDYALNAWVVEIGSDRPYYHASDTGLIDLSLLEYLSIEVDDTLKGNTARVVLDSLSLELERVKAEENPFSCTRQLVKGVGDREARLSFFVPHANESGYWWQGENARIASMAAMFRSAADQIEKLTALCPEPCTTSEREGFEQELREAADSQLDWILGCNPFDICMLQGYGRNNPRYEKHYPNAPGGICNGITGGFEDELDIDFLPASVEGQGDHRWRWSEQWIPHASWFLLAIVHEL